MSPTENPIIPAPHEAILTTEGVCQWRPFVTSLTVHEDGTGRHIVVRVDGEEHHRFRLSAEQAATLARVLTSSPQDLAA